MRGALGVGLLALAVSGLAGCRPAHRNVVLVSMDTVRRDHCSVYGYARDTTPYLKRLARRGVTFDLAYAPTATTGPSHATLFTSLYPTTHGVLRNSMVLADDFATLAEHLAAAGYETKGVVSSIVLKARVGYAQGFDDFDDDLSVFDDDGRRVGEAVYRLAADTTRRALTWLRQRPEPERPFFLFVHYFDPHSPYSPPPPFYGRFGPAPTGPPEEDLEGWVRRYDEEIAYTDQEIGRLLAGVSERFPDTVFVVTADHGEGLLAHGLLEHGAQIYEEAVRVPLVMSAPTLPPGRVVAEPVELLDVAPTVLSLIGLEPPAGFAGRDLTPALTDSGELPREHPVFLLRRYYRDRGVQLGIRKGAWKYVVGEREATRELYHLERDPLERENLYAEHRDRAASLEAEIEDWRRATVSTRSAESVSEDDRIRLEALGYVD